MIAKLTGLDQAIIFQLKEKQETYAVWQSDGGCVTQGKNKDKALAGIGEASGVT